MPTNLREFRKLRPLRFIPRLLQFPSFSETYVTWPNASYAITELAAAAGFDYAFKVPVAAPNETFVAVIRTNVADVYTRYKLWTTGTEIVPFPLYGGELIANAESPTLEIWIVQGELTAAVGTAWNLTIGLLSEPTSISDTSQIITAV